MTPLVLRVSMGGGDRLPSGDPSARLPSYFIKKKIFYCVDIRYHLMIAAVVTLMLVGKLRQTNSEFVTREGSFLAS